MIGQIGHDKHITKLENEIDYVMAELKANEYNLGRKNILKKRLERVQNNHRNMCDRKDILFLNCADQYAETYRYVWNIHNILTDADDKPLWDSIVEFESFDMEVVKGLVSAYNRGFILKECEVRKVARSGIWQILYNSVESTTQLFNKPVADFDINQINLIYWTTIYKNATECAEPPTDDILNNDNEFDSWLKSYGDKIRKERAKNNISGTNTGKGNLQETFVMTDELGADKLYEQVGKPEIKFKK